MAVLGLRAPQARVVCWKATVHYFRPTCACLISTRNVGNSGVVLSMLNIETPFHMLIWYKCCRTVTKIRGWKVSSLLSSNLRRSAALDFSQRYLHVLQTKNFLQYITVKPIACPRTDNTIYLDNITKDLLKWYRKVHSTQPKHPFGQS